MVRSLMFSRYPLPSFSAPLGFDDATVRRVVKLVRNAEFKRKQAAPVLKVTSRAFGTGWRMPIARGG